MSLPAVRGSSPKADMKAGAYGCRPSSSWWLFLMPGLCGWFDCLDHAGQRYLVVMSAALQLVVVTAGDRAGSPPSALEAGHWLRFRPCPTSPRLDGCVSSLLKET